MNKGLVEFVDGITIYDENNQEIVHWSEQEWIDEPEVVYSITKAIDIVYTDGIEKLKKILNK